jgi:hypothetical protein
MAIQEKSSVECGTPIWVSIFGPVRRIGIGKIQRRSGRGAAVALLSDRLTKLPFKEELIRGFV